MSPYDRRALVLPGAGANGAIEAGFLDVARAVGFTFPCVAGTSAGAVNAASVAFNVKGIGSLWADALSAGKLEDWVSPIPTKAGRMLGLLSSHRSLIKGDAVRAWLEKFLGGAQLGESPAHLRMFTFDKRRRRLRKIDSAIEDDRRIIVVDAVMSSLAVPFVFPQQRLHRNDPTPHCDGGIVRNVPASTWDDRPDLRTLVLRFRADESPKDPDTIGEDVEIVFDGMRDASEDEQSAKPSTETVELEAMPGALRFNQPRANTEAMVRAGEFAAKTWIGRVRRAAA